MEKRRTHEKTEAAIPSTVDGTAVFCRGNELVLREVQGPYTSETSVFMDNGELVQQGTRFVWTCDASDCSEDNYYLSGLESFESRCRQ